MSCLPFILLACFTSASLCFLRLSFKKQISGFQINSTEDLPQKIALSYDGSLIACINVTRWPRFYSLSSTGGYEDVTKVQEAYYTSDIVFARKSLNYTRLMASLKKPSSVYLKSLQRPRLRAFGNGQNLAIGNNDQVIVYSSPTHLNHLNYSLVYVLTNQFQVSFKYQCQKCGNFQMVLSGKSFSKAVIMREYEQLEVVRLIISPEEKIIQFYQTLALYYDSYTWSKWLAVDFSYNENFIVASVQPNTFTVWILRDNGYYAEVQTENLSDGGQNKTIKKLRFSNDEQRLFVGTDEEVRIYIRDDLRQTEKPFKLGYSIPISFNSVSDMSADGTTVVSMNKTSVRIIKIVDGSVLQEALLLGVIPLLIVVIIVLMAYFLLRFSKSIFNSLRISATFTEIKQNQQRQEDRYLSETQQNMKNI